MPEQEGLACVQSMRLELIKAKMRRCVPSAVVESVIKRALVVNRVDLRDFSQTELEAVVAGAVSGLRSIINPAVLATLMMELTEILAEASDEFDAGPGSVRGFSGIVRIARDRR